MDKTEKLRQIALEYSQAVKELQTIQKMEDEKKKEIRQIIQEIKKVMKC